MYIYVYIYIYIYMASDADTLAARSGAKGSRSWIGELKVPCSYELTAMGELTFLMHMSEFRLSVSSF